MFKKIKIFFTFLVAIFMVAVFIFPPDQIRKDKSNNIKSWIDSGTAERDTANNNLNADKLITDQNKSVSAPEEGHSNLFLVSRVIDGDTIELNSGERVRYIGINTPEITLGKNECFGAEASKENKKLVEGKYVLLERDVSETDKYDRLLRYVWLGDVMVNQYLVAHGYAQVATYPPDVKYQKNFLEAQKIARESKIGLWGDVCESSQKIINNQYPPNPDCAIKGNISSSGEKIYHLLGCDYYEQTFIDLNKGEMWFCTETEAQNFGWRKAKNCP